MSAKNLNKKLAEFAKLRISISNAEFKRFCENLERLGL